MQQGKGVSVDEQDGVPKDKWRWKEVAETED